MVSNIVYVAVGGSLGAICRFLIAAWIHEGQNHAFPVGTLAVNAAGCLAIGFLGTWADEKLLLSPQFRHLIFIGFLGAFTTFSTFTFETWGLIKEELHFYAAAYIGLSMASCFLGLFIGIILAARFAD